MSVRIFFDFIDPLSYLALLEWAGPLRAMESSVRWMPFELHPPPTPLVAVDDRSLADRWRTAREVAGTLGVSFAPPRLVPWTRKAHELVQHATETGADVHDLRRSIFEAYLLEGRDIGRVDVLVDLARAASLDATDAKATLDVDRYDASVTAMREEAARDGIRETPTVVRGEERIEGFHNGTMLGTFLGTRSPGRPPGDRTIDPD